MTINDTPTSMTQTFADRQQKAGQAHMVLSVGNKGYVRFSLRVVDSGWRAGSI